MASTRIQSILLSVSNKVQRLMEADRFYVALYDAERATLEFPLVVEGGEPVGPDQTAWTARSYQGRARLPDRVIEQRSLLLFEHVLKEELAKEGIEYWPGDGCPLSWLGAPMVFEEKVIGALVAENQQKSGAFGEGGVRILSTVARQTAMAIQKARLDARLERKIASLSALNEMGRQLTAGIRLSEPEILELIYKEASRVMDTKNMYIALYDKETDVVWFALAFLHGQPVEVETANGWKPRRVAVGKGRTEWIIRQKKPLVSNTRAEWNAWYAQPEHEDYVDQPFVSWIGVPMMVGETVLGVIATYHATQEFAYDEDDLEVLSLMASQAAIALDNARQLTALQEIGVSITSELELTEVLGLIAENANRIVSADFSTLFPYDSERDAFEGGIRRGKIEVEPSVPSNTGFAARIAKTQNAIFAEDAEGQPGVESNFLKNKGVKSFAGAPLIFRGRTVGVLYVNFFEPHRFSPEEQETIRLLANQAAVAIENARLYQHLEVRLRTTEKQRVALERLVGLNDLAGRFVHRVSNLAGTIPLDIEYIQEELKSDEPDYGMVLRELEEVHEHATQLLGMARRIRESTQKLGESRDSRFLQRLDVKELLDRAVAEVRGAERRPRWGNRIVINKPYKEAPPMIIETFRTLFTEALVNLISNAIDAMPKGGTLTLAAKCRQVEGQECAVLELADTGVGIPAEDLERIYDIEYSKKPGGFGYGLWLVQHICDATGTTVEVSSVEGEGTTFRLLVPLVEGVHFEEDIK